MTTLAFAGALLAAFALFLLHAAAAAAFTSDLRGRGTTRLLALALVMAFSATAAFQWLLAMHRFFLTEALVLSALYAASAHVYLQRTRRAWSHVLAALRRDAAHLARLAMPREPMARAVAAFALLAAALVAARAWLLPPLAWDTLTSHAPKASLWVQTGAPIRVSAPGGWGFSVYYPGGSETLMAWAMLPFHADFALGLLDVGAWCALALATFVAARTLGLRARDARAVAVATAFLPVALHETGSSYAELLLSAQLAAAWVFTVRAWRDRRASDVLLACFALGLAAGTKLTALPIVAVSAGGLLLRASGPAFTAGLAAIALCVVPGWLTNLDETGYMLARTPVQVFGFALGEASDALRAYLDRPALVHAGLATELAAWRTMFAWPWQPGLHLDALTLVFAVLAPFGVWRLARRDRAAAALAAVFVLAVVLPFASDGFRVIRLLWAPSNARFLLPVAGLVLALGLRALAPRSRVRTFAVAVLLATALVHAVVVVRAWPAFEWPGVSLALACLALPVLVVLASRRLPVVGRAAVVVLALLAAGLLQQGNRRAFREDAWSRSRVMGPVPRTWLPAAMMLDTLRTPARIAVTSGPAQDADQWFLQPLLGERLQHRFEYVPVTRTGTIVDWFAPLERQEPADEAAWRARLDERAITHVMCFAPRATELPWLEADATHFRVLAGDRRTWGLYERIAPRQH